LKQHARLPHTNLILTRLKSTVGILSEVMNCSREGPASYVDVFRFGVVC